MKTRKTCFNLIKKQY